MAANMIGNNTEDMQDLMNKLTTAIDQIQSAMGTVDGKVQSVLWNGPDADRFRGTEWPNSKTQLNKVISDLNTVRSTVQRQKDEQVTASNS